MRNTGGQWRNSLTYSPMMCLDPKGDDMHDASGVASDRDDEERQARSVVFFETGRNPRFP
jgi:hypothetical protein